MVAALAHIIGLFRQNELQSKSSEGKFGKIDVLRGQTNGKIYILDHGTMCNSITRRQTRHIHKTWQKTAQSARIGQRCKTPRDLHVSLAAQIDVRLQTKTNQKILVEPRSVGKLESTRQKNRLCLQRQAFWQGASLMMVMHPGTSASIIEGFGNAAWMISSVPNLE